MVCFSPKKSWDFPIDHPSNRRNPPHISWENRWWRSQQNQSIDPMEIHGNPWNSLEILPIFPKDFQASDALIFERCYVFPGVIPQGREPAVALEALQQRMRNLSASGDAGVGGGWPWELGDFPWENHGKTMGKPMGKAMKQPKSDFLVGERGKSKLGKECFVWKIWDDRKTWCRKRCLSFGVAWDAKWQFWGGFGLGMLYSKLEMISGTVKLASKIRAFGSALCPRHDGRDGRDGGSGAGAARGGSWKWRGSISHHNRTICNYGHCGGTVGRLDDGSDRRVCKLHIGCGTHYSNGFNMLQSQTPTEWEWNLFRQSVRTETSTSFRLLDTEYTTLQRFTDGQIPTGRSSNFVDAFPRSLHGIWRISHGISHRFPSFLTGYPWFNHGKSQEIDGSPWHGFMAPWILPWLTMASARRNRRWVPP